MADPISAAAVWVASNLAIVAGNAGATAFFQAAVYAVAYAATYAAAIAATSAFGSALAGGQKSPAASEGQLTLQQPIPHRRRIYGKALLGQGVQFG